MFETKISVNVLRPKTLKVSNEGSLRPPSLCSGLCLGTNMSHPLPPSNQTSNFVMSSISVFHSLSWNSWDLIFYLHGAAFAIDVMRSFFPSQASFHTNWTCFESSVSATSQGSYFAGYSKRCQHQHWSPNPCGGITWCAEKDIYPIFWLSAYFYVSVFYKQKRLLNCYTKSQVGRGAGSSKKMWEVWFYTWSTENWDKDDERNDGKL